MSVNHSRDVLDDLDNLRRRIRDLEASRTLGAQTFPCTSTTRPANPAVGRQILETDTGLQAYWSGTAWVYPPQLLYRQTLSALGSAITLPVPSGGHFNNLRVIWTGASNSGGTATYMCCRLNNDSSSSDYTWQFNQASGTTQSSAGATATDSEIRVGTLAEAGGTAGYLGGGEFVIPNATGSTYKVVTAYSNSQNGVTSGFSGTYGGLWPFTAAITSVQLVAASGSLIAGSTASLYGWT